MVIMAEPSTSPPFAKLIMLQCLISILQILATNASMWLEWVRRAGSSAPIDVTPRNGGQ